MASPARSIKAEIALSAFAKAGAGARYVDEGTTLTPMHPAAFPVAA